MNQLDDWIEKWHRNEGEMGFAVLLILLLKKEVEEELAYGGEGETFDRIYDAARKQWRNMRSGRRQATVAKAKGGGK